MDKLRIPLAGKLDRNEDEYYYTTTTLPVLIDLSKTVLHVYPYEEDDGRFGAELVVRHYDPNFQQNKSADRRKGRKVRRQHRRDESVPTAPTDPTDEAEVEDDTANT